MASRSPRRRVTFVVGRLDRASTEVQPVRPAPSPIRGPFALRAVVRPGAPSPASPR